MIFYRYETGYEHPDEYTQIVIVVTKEYQLINETPKGYWIWIVGDTGTTKWVSKTSKKRFAYPTKKEAIDNFVARQICRKKILLSQARVAQKAMEIGLRIQQEP